MAAEAMPLIQARCKVGSVEKRAVTWGVRTSSAATHSRRKYASGLRAADGPSLHEERCLEFLLRIDDDPLGIKRLPDKFAEFVDGVEPAAEIREATATSVMAVEVLFDGDGKMYRTRGDKFAPDLAPSPAASSPSSRGGRQDDRQANMTTSQLKSVVAVSIYPTLVGTIGLSMPVGIFQFA
ncbi:hypothetical protein QYE76_068681 [Lolium multiflorum]|uniref:Uncharacterized protein n=1 Tax=Lolium multiflorum TaxID=4521 RepID=A0AAD8SG96_LOLMU|nr:hypothetical protein QYE76_068681 [Lolium multiflorum]